jgi:hypothetical protein
VVTVDSYTDEHYDVSLSIDKDGKPKIERIYGNQRLGELQGVLKVFVKADLLLNPISSFYHLKELIYQQV